MKKAKDSTDQVEYRHPSYGVVTVTRQSGSKENLFGTMTPGYHTMCLRISEALVTHNTANSTIMLHPERRVIEVNLSMLQWAQLVSGVEETPCTITWRDGKFINDNPAPITTLAIIHEEFQIAMADLGKLADEIRKHADELDEKPNITKADRKRYKDLASGVASNIAATQPHIMSKIALCAERMIAEAKANQVSPPGS